MLRYYDVNFNLGGPIKHDKVWWHFSWRRQFNAVEQPLFTFDQSFDTWNQNPSAKVTYQLNQKNKIIGYYQWNMKEQPNRLPIGGYTYTDPTQTSRQVSPSWVYKAEWNGTVSDRLYLEARWGDFGYYDPRYANSDEDYFWRDTTLLVLTGAHAESQTDRDRKQTDRRGHLLPRHQVRQPHLQVRRRDLQRNAVERPRAERRRQHRAHLHQQRLEPARVRRADRDVRLRPLRQRQRPAAGRQQARSAGLLRQRHLVARAASR